MSHEHKIVNAVEKSEVQKRYKQELNRYYKQIEKINKKPTRGVRK